MIVAVINRYKKAITADVVMVTTYGMKIFWVADATYPLRFHRKLSRTGN